MLKLCGLLANCVLYLLQLLIIDTVFDNTGRLALLLY